MVVMSASKTLLINIYLYLSVRINLIRNGGQCIPRVLGDYVCSCPQPYCGLTCTNIVPTCNFNIYVYLKPIWLLKLLSKLKGTSQYKNSLRLAGSCEKSHCNNRGTCEINHDNKTNGFTWYRNFKYNFLMIY